MQFNHQYSHQFRSPPGGNKFGASPARDPPYSTCRGTLSERHQANVSLNNESDRMKDFITESNQPGKYMVSSEYAPRSPMYPKPDVIAASSPRNVMSGILPATFNDGVSDMRYRQTSPNQQRRQQNRRLHRSEIRKPGQDITSSASAVEQDSLFRSRKAQRVSQSFKEIDQKILDPKTYHYDPDRPPKMTKIQDQVLSQTSPFGPDQYYGNRLETEARARIPRLRSNTGPRLAIDPHPEVIPAGTVVVPSHVSTLCGQKLVKLTDVEQNKIAEPRLPGFNRSSYMTETLGGKPAPRHDGHADGKVPSFPIITTEGMEGQWKPWSICHDAPEFMIEQHGDPKAILRKIKRAPREKKPVYRIGYDGHVNPWSVSDESPAWIEGHMKQYDTNAILSRSVKKVDRARRQFENSHTTASSQINDVINGATYHHNDTSAFNDSKWS